MARPRKKRPIPVEISGPDKHGRYHAFLLVGKKPNGEDDRRHRSGHSPADVEDKIRRLMEQIDRDGRAPRPGQIPTVGEWLQSWLDTTVSGLRYATREDSYGWAVRVHLIPGLGGWRLDQLQPEAIEAFYRRLARPADQGGAGLAPASVHSVHRTLHNALTDAVRKQRILANPVDRAKKPTLPQVEITPLYVDEVQRIVEVCDGRRNGTRWTIGMPLGLRQGEALGLPWYTAPRSTRERDMGLDLDTGRLYVARKAQRRKWRHGCTDPVRCARWAHGCRPVGACRRDPWACPRRQVRCRTGPCRGPWQHGCSDPAVCVAGKHRASCPPGCAGHARTCPRRAPGPCTRHLRVQCPPPCPPDCTGHAKACPQRRGGGIVFDDPKSEAGHRYLVLDQVMLAELRAHRSAQAAERLAAGPMWTDHNLVWCRPDGRPLDKREDWRDWKEILRLAGVRDARIHDGRHTAATMLLLKGVDPRVVQELMGWSNGAILKLYQHVVDELRQAATEGLSSLLWGSSATSSATSGSR